MGKWPDKDIEQFIKLVTRNGVVAYEEFMGQLMAIKAPEENKILADIFREFDTQRKGYLNIRDIGRLLERPAISRVLGKRDPVEVLQHMDKDGDGHVNFEEFKYAMEHKKSKPTNKVELYYGFTVEKGDKLKYHSSTHDRWLPCVITAVDSKRRAVQIDLKPNYWMKGAELLKLKCDNKATAVPPKSGSLRKL